MIDIKGRFEHKSLYICTPVELRVKLKKEAEQFWIYVGNSIIAGLIGAYLFYQGYQHSAIILYMMTVVMAMAGLFQNQHIEMIDQAIYLLEHTQEAERFA